MTSLAVRYFFVAEDDEIIQLSQKKMDRLTSNESPDRISEFADQRMRWAEVVIEHENRKPSHVVRAVFRYLHFDPDGCLDKDRYLRDAVVAMDAAFPAVASENAPHNVIPARRQFAERRCEHTVRWAPNAILEHRIADAALGHSKHRRL